MFSDPAAVARYADGPVRLVPGFHDLQKMTGLLLAERAGPQAKLLILGAGGGLELKVFAQTYPEWTFVGIDPSAEMLALATKTVGDFTVRIDLHQG